MRYLDIRSHFGGLEIIERFEDGRDPLVLNFLQPGDDSNILLQELEDYDNNTSDVFPEYVEHRNYIIEAYL